MAVTYNAEKIGTLIVRQGEHNYNVEIRRGNCLAVLITPNGEGGMFLYSFFADRQHLVNIQKHYGKVIFDEVVDCRLNMRYKESKTLLEFFVKSFDVICYYE